MAFTELYCDYANGSNVNAGDNAQTAVTTTNGAYTQGGGAGGKDRFVAAGGTPFSLTVVGQLVSIYNDGVSPTTFIGRITAVNSSTSIDISLTAISGTRPTTAATGKSATVGGVWKGPNAASSFPFGVVASTLTDASGDMPRVNFKNNATYSVTAQITSNKTGPLVYQGYTSTPGDGGKAAFDAGAGGITVLAHSGTLSIFRDLIFQNNTASGNGLSMTGSRNIAFGCVARNIDLNGFNVTAADNLFIECEAYNCALNVGSGAGFSTNTSTTYVRCISYLNELAGFWQQGAAGVGATYISCISASNFNNFYCSGLGGMTCIGCASVNGLSDAFLAANSFIVVLNSIFSDNSGYGVSTGSTALTLLDGNAFYNNSSGPTFGVNPSLETNDITLSGDPFVAAVNGNFALNNTAGAGASCRGTGIGVFMTTASYSGTISATTNATPVKVTTSAPHGLLSGAIVTITGAGTGVNGTWTINYVDASNFTLIGSTAPGATYSSGSWNNGTPSGALYTATTSSYPDVGAAQVIDTGGGNTVIAFPVYQNLYDRVEITG